jgi:shikimate dehydrogenase
VVPAGPPISATTTLVGVIGDPIAHSLSPLLYNTAFAAAGLDWVCLAFRVPAGGAAGALTGVRSLGLAGLSVTMPHKQDVAGLVDECTGPAGRLGAVNCVISREGRLVGDNTDGSGFLGALVRGAGFAAAGRRCVVAGTGGAARAVVLALAGAGAAEVAVVGRSPRAAAVAAGLAGPAGRVGAPEDAAGADLVVDATPVGMADSPGADGVPVIDPGLLGAGQVVCDLVYHPLTTPWLAAAAARGAVTVGGLGMLVHQAAEQFERWTARTAPVEAMWAAVSAAPIASTGT